MKIKIQKLNPEAKIPNYAKPGDAGMDLYSAQDLILKPGERTLVGTGIKMELPDGYASLIWDKSGIAGNFGIKTMGGVIDATYRGEYKIVLINLSKKDFIVKKGIKIAQILIQKVEQAEIEIVENLSETERGENSFGSTGL